MVLCPYLELPGFEVATYRSQLLLIPELVLLVTHFVLAVAQLAQARRVSPLTNFTGATMG